MRRIKLVFGVAAVMVAMLVAFAAPAMAVDSDLDGIDDGNFAEWWWLAAFDEDLGLELLDLDLADNGTLEEAEFGGWEDDTPFTFDVGADGEVTDFEWDDSWE